MVEKLEGKIKTVMNKVASMKVAEVKQSNLQWMTPSLKEGMKTERELQRQHRLTGGEKQKRSQVSKELRRAKKVYAHKGLKDKAAHSKDIWQGVKAHPGWESTGAPTRLVKETKQQQGKNM